MDMLDLIKRKNLGEMWIAETPSGETAAAEVVIYDSNVAHRWSAASSEEHLNTGATSFLLSEIMNNLANQNVRSINLMAGNVAHLSTFIASFNPDLAPYYGVEFSRARYNLLNGLRAYVKSV